MHKIIIIIISWNTAILSIIIIINHGKDIIIMGRSLSLASVVSRQNPLPEGGFPSLHPISYPVRV
jgi:hypothetical protein